MSKPLLSIGIIFKNEIRCLERCLKSLQPVRNAIPCELVMADTGADDGSREIAEKYADILFDFPWINDFSAARNAVMDRCSGKWFFCIDCDEWLDKDVSSLINFVRDNKRKENFAALTARNHDTYDGGGSYTDFVTIRLVRMSTGQRYVGAIHEHWEVDGQIAVYFLADLYMNHDGYVTLNTKDGGDKRDRNLSLIREKLKADPDNLLSLMQYIESGKSEKDFLDVIRHVKSLIDEKKGDWKALGPPLLRYVAEAAYNHNLPEFDDWVKDAQEMFPDSYYTRVDVGYLEFGHSFEKQDYGACITLGKRYLKAVKDYNKNRLNNLTARMYSVVKVASPYWVQQIKIFMAVAYANLEQFEHIPELIRDMDWSIIDTQQTTHLSKLLALIQSYSQVDISDLTVKIWKGITTPKPTQQKADERKLTFLNYMATLFVPRYRMEEEGKSKFQRYAYTLLVPLEKYCELGRSAAVLAAEDPELMAEKLNAVEDWEAFSIHALSHALSCGATFPPAGKQVKLEEMDALVKRLSGGQKRFFELTRQSAERLDQNNWQQVVWVSRLLLSAVQLYPWAGQEENEEPGMFLAQAFSRVAGEFMRHYYNSNILRSDMIFVLPPLHRFSWYCAHAFEALEQGNTVEYVRMLREGLTNCESMKNMVEFLIDRTQEVQKRLVSPELISLADQVRVILAKFAPDDPAVAALKQSEAYRKVAHLVEGPVIYTRAGSSKQ